MRRKQRSTFTDFKGRVSKGVPLRVPKKAGRNAPCPCGSGKKFKACHGRPVRDPIRTTKGGYTDMRALYNGDQRQQEQEFVKQWGFNPNPAQLLVFTTGDNAEMTAMIVKGLRAVSKKNNVNNDRFIHAVETCGCLITPKNQELVDDAVKQQWEKVLTDYDAEHPREPE